MIARVLLSCCALGSLVFCSGFATAKALHDSPYNYRQTFGSALRLVKVDLGYDVTETNSEWGYVMFEYTSPDSGKRKNRGSLQFVRGKDKIQVAVQVPSMPSYHEQIIVQKLKQKLASEHGNPPMPAKSAKSKKRKSKSSDKNKSGDKGKQDSGKKQDGSVSKPGR